MIIRFLRWLSNLDRSYFFAVSALISGLLISVSLIFAPIAQRADGSDVSLLERDGGIVIILLMLPVLVLITPLVSLPQRAARVERSHKINSIAATIVLLAFIVISLPSFGLFYLPPLIFTTASSVSLFFGKNRKAFADNPEATAQRQDDGIRMSRSARKRAALEQAESDSPLASSRRRRGRNRRKR